MYKGLRTIDLDAPKDWVRPAAILIENNYRLDAGFYKPQSVDTTKYDPPQQIIDELLEIENRITEGLRRLMSLVEEPK